MLNYYKCKNILWLVDHLGHHGTMHGAGKYYLNIIPAISRHKYDITLCVLRKRDALTKYFEDKRIKIKHLERSKYDPFTMIDVLRVVKHRKIDLIHAHGYGSANFARLSRAIVKIPVIVHSHDDDRVYPTSQRIADILLAPFNYKAIAVSESVREASVKKRKIKMNKISTMHNAISLQYFTFPEVERIQKERNRLGIKIGYKVVGTVTRLREEKGTRYFIEAAARVLKVFPEAIFLIVGDGPLKNELANLADSLNIGQKVVFAGFCDDIPAVLSLMNIVVIPSLTEGSPLALLEAMATGKPIVATKVGGIMEILKDKETGLLVPAKNSMELADKILYLIKNPNAAQAFSVKVLEEVKKYDIVKHSEKLEKCYEEIFSNKTL